MKHFSGIIVFIIVLVSTSSITEAADFGFGPRMGFYKSEDAQEDVYGYFGIQARLKFNQVFTGEFCFDYREDKYQLEGENELTITHYPILLSGIFTLIPDSPVQPYALFGIGWYNSIESYDYGYGYDTDEEFNQEIGYHAGGGLEIYFARNISLSSDIRYNALKIEESENEEKLNAGGWIFNMGLTFYF